MTKHSFFSTSSRRGEAAFYAAPLGLWSPSSSISNEAMFIIGGLLVALAALLFFMHRRQNKETADALFVQETPQHTNEILQAASDKRLRVDLVCARQNIKHRQLQGLFVLPEKVSHVFVALYGGVSPDDWKDAPVDVYFHTNEQGAKTFYHFSTFVQDIRQQGNVTLLVLPRPSMLTNNQRREFVRITPGSGMVETATAWQLPALNSPLPPNVSALGRPHFAFRPPNVFLLEVVDIAASGTRLRVPLQQVQKHPFALKAHTRFCILLILDGLKNDDSKIHLWLQAVCLRIQAVPGNRHVDLGLQFTHWYKTDSITAPIEWELVEQDGEVPVLLQWVGRVNILLNRLAE